jgi:hypothetical protein
VWGFLFIGSEVELDFKFVVAMVNPSVLQASNFLVMPMLGNRQLVREWAFSESLPDFVFPCCVLSLPFVLLLRKNQYLPVLLETWYWQEDCFHLVGLSIELLEK